ncbi:TolC family outer membrane protein [Sulfurimonas sp.]|uniref:TolC family outer membrane protein n=1 Tax=Sulfurimonas sp. TaxID=2022749 RepID=UPI00262EE91B|nr:TolC family outer membrane protein [Sulfurimonas sp.]
MKYILASALALPSLLSALTISQAVQQTIETNPKIYIKKAALGSEKELLSKEKSGYLPSVDFYYSVGRERSRMISNSRDTVINTTQNVTGTVSENIFEGFKTQSGVDKQKALIVSAEKNMQNVVNNTALDAAAAYINIIKNKYLTKIAKENVAVHKKYLAQIKERVDAGVARKSDYKQTLSRYANAQSNYYFAEQNYKNAITSFQKVLDMKVNPDDFKEPSIDKLPTQNIEELIKLALEKNPELLMNHADIKSAKALVVQSKATYYPKVDLKLQSYWHKNLNGIVTNATNPYDTEDAYSAQAVLSYNIFRGFSDKAVVESNKYKLLEKENALADLRRKVIADVKTSWQTYSSTKEQMKFLNQQIEASKETVKDYHEEYNLGRRSIVDLLNIELEYNSAKNRFVKAKYEHYLAYYKLLTYTDEMLEEMNVSVK